MSIKTIYKEKMENAKRMTIYW